MGEVFMAYHPDPCVRDYDDRGMAKWLGFYLSEHTSEMEKNSLYRNKIWERKESMNDIEIAKVLKAAFSERKSVIIQLDSLDTENHAFADIVGIVEGFGDNNVYVSDPDSGIEIIAIDTINNITLVEQGKWSDVL